MKPTDIARLRLHLQHISQQSFAKPEDVVRWLVAVQAQDYLQSLWAVGLRLKNARAEDIEQALIDKTIVRTWPLRGTIHYTAPEDVRWMLKYLAPRVIVRYGTVHRQLGLDAKTLTKGMKVFTKALQGSAPLTRPELYEALERAKIDVGEQRGLHLLVYSALKGLICVAPRRGKQPTFALLDEWLLATKMPDRDEALASLAKRYFASHGPATLQDFAWWAGLTATDARKYLDIVKKEFEEATVEGQTYWFKPVAGKMKSATGAVFLLPPFDEYTVAYKDRSVVLEETQAASTGNGIFRPVVIAGQRIVGTWKRTQKKNVWHVETEISPPFAKAKQDVLKKAIKHYVKFLGTEEDL
jgi:hypothetical protein